MDSAVRSRPNHYETLGLTPRASSDEIARAFAREVSALRPRPFGGVAHVSIAYETLRDPVKRQAYDAALGLTPEPRPHPSSSSWRIGAHFMETASVGPVKRPEQDELPPPAPPAPPAPQATRPLPPRPEPIDEPRLPSFLAAALREPVIPDARDIPEPPENLAPRPLKPDLGDFLAPPRAKLESPDIDVDDSPIEWRRSAMTVGGVVLAVAVLAAVAGWSAGLAEVPQEVEPVASTALPAAQSSSEETAAPTPVEAGSVVGARPERPAPAAVAAARIERAPAAPPLAAPEQQPGEAAPVGRSLELAAEQTIAQLPAASAVQANLPLPNNVVARTIGRIGYSCGQVASTAPVDGSSGVFKVTCTSGQSYRAAPVRGRYRFSRWGGQ